MSLIGPIITGGMVRKALIETVKDWSPSYLAEVGAEAGKDRAALPHFRSFPSFANVNRMTEDQLPACITSVPGLASEPSKESGGVWRAAWAAGVAVVVTSATKEATKDLTELYTAAVRGLLLQHPSLGGFAKGLDWVDERYDVLDTTDERTIAGGVIEVAVLVDGVVESFGGLSEPPPLEDHHEDPGDWPTVIEGGATATVEEMILDG